MTNSYVKYDKTKNRIYIVLEGSFDLSEVTRINKEYARVIKEASPDFTVLSDVSKYIPGSDEVQKIHANSIKMAGEAGVAKVARVVGNTPLGGMQIIRIAHKEVSYPSKNFKTIKEAEEYLDND